MSSDEKPHGQIRIETAGVSPEEIAVVLAVLCATGAGEGQVPTPRSDWAGRARVGWRSSGLPASRFLEGLPR